MPSNNNNNSATTMRPIKNSRCRRRPSSTSKMTRLLLLTALSVIFNNSNNNNHNSLIAMADGGADDQYINEGAEDYYNENVADDQQGNDDAANNNAANDDQAQAAAYAYNYDDVYSNNDAENPYAEDGSILYWTDFAIFPKRCVNWNGVDQVKFSMFEKSSKHCNDSPMGTYLTPVSTIVNAYLNQLVNNAADEGDADFEVPEVAAAYAQCGMGPQINGMQYYYQVGCSDTNPLALAVNIYEDDACTTPSTVDGYDDSNMEMDITLPFQKCTPCVIWMDKNDDEVDDRYYLNKQTDAPLCSSAWEYKEECNGKCQMKTSYSEGWNKADKVLLTILSFFGFGMCISIISKRQKMSHKDALMEQAAISAAGLQQSHILGSFLLLILIIAVFGLLGLKKITWFLLLTLNIVLFAYLMKLTVDGSVKETVIGPDGKIVPEEYSDEEDDEYDDEEEGEGYQNPTLPVQQTELPEIS